MLNIEYVENDSIHIEKRNVMDPKCTELFQTGQMFIYNEDNPNGYQALCIIAQVERNSINLIAITDDDPQFDKNIDTYKKSNANRIFAESWYVLSVDNITSAELRNFIMLQSKSHSNIELIPVDVNIIVEVPDINLTERL